MALLRTSLIHTKNHIKYNKSYQIPEIGEAVLFRFLTSLDTR